MLQEGTRKFSRGASPLALDAPVILSEREESLRTLIVILSIREESLNVPVVILSASEESLCIPTVTPTAVKKLLK